MSASSSYWSRVSEAVRAGEWRCLCCGYINSTEVWHCSDCDADPDGNRTPEEHDE